MIYKIDPELSAIAASYNEGAGARKMSIAFDAYIRKCRVLRVTDGDTIHISVDLGYRVSTVQCVRLLGVNCPEVKGETRDAGVAAHRFVLDWLSSVTCEDYIRGGWEGDFIIRTEKSDSFDRWLGVIYAENGECLNDELLKSGHAVPWVKK
jgi:micrococcal nuclease